MWDPVSIFAICWMMNIGLPASRLDVKSVVEMRENTVVVQSISDQIKLRPGL